MSISSVNKLNLPLNDANNQLGEIENIYQIDTDHAIGDFEATINNLHIKFADPFDTFDFGNIPKDSIIRLKKLPNKEIKKSFLQYLKEKEKVITLGDQWAFLKVGDQYYAYGANIVLIDKVQREKSLVELIETLEKETKSSKTIFYSIALFIFLVATIIVILQFYDKKEDEGLLVVLGGNHEPDSIEFLKKQFPDIYKWKETGTIEQKELARIIFDNRKIVSIWKHVNSKSWNANLSKYEKISAQARFILFDLMNYNSDFRQQCTKKDLIKNTRFSEICSIYEVAYKSTIFFWKTGHVDKLAELDEVKKTFKKYDMPISQSDYEYCFDKRIAVVEMEGLQTVSLKIPKSKKNELPSDWVVAVIENLNSNSGMKWSSLVLFKLGVPTSISSNVAKLIKPTDDVKLSDKVNSIVRWATIPTNIVNSLKLKDKKYSKEYLISEKVVVFTDMFRSILNDKFLDTNETIISAEKSRDMLINIPSNTIPECSKENKNVSVKNNKDGTYGVGLSTEDPIKSSLMRNILNRYTIPELKHEVSELHESNISILRNNESGGGQERIFIDSSLVDDFRNSNSFSIYKDKKELYKFINVEKESTGIHDYAYSYDNNYDNIYITTGFKELSINSVEDIEINIGNKKAYYKIIDNGGRIIPKKQ